MAQRLAKHGSNAGYQREQKTGQICDRCRAAHRVWNTQYTKAGRAKGLKFKSYDVIDHLAKPAQARGHGRAPAGTVAEAQTQATTGATVNQPETETGHGTPSSEPGIGQRLRDAVSRLAVPDDTYVEDSEMPEYLRTIDPDPDPSDPESATVADNDFVITKESMAVIEENMGTYLSVIGMTLEMVDPYCGPVLAENLDNIVNRWSKVIARYPAAAKIFMAKGGGMIMDWIGAIQATWPVLYAIYEHHLAHTIITEKGRVMRVTRNANGQGPEVDATMPPVPDTYAYTVN